ncbi:hypothetical protein [Varibaculum cambriense]|uniref:hypothetical protein n=1 Tax=Varibaculum cambriense TaxID=184870 RepID=UPI002552B902|nr:hypothetical protein [Varibaculum cambriense]MDK8275398.1 hypothetical protein [Varibaculum cambriense]
MIFNKEGLNKQYSENELIQVKQALTEWINYLVGVQKEFRELDRSNKILLKINNSKEELEYNELTVISHALNYRKEMLIKRKIMEKDCLKAIETTERLKLEHEKD